MTTEELKSSLAATVPSAVFDESGEWLNINIEANDLRTVALQLRNDPACWFDYLFCLTCIDWKTHLTMVYHLTSTRFRTNIVLKIKVSSVSPEIETLSDIWQTANFHEREVYEMFGVNFLNHPDLRLLILPDGWEGKKPMLKDFEDPINMIRL
jgi:NADH:ubiquinone oxidoreductase subunit C